MSQHNDHQALGHALAEAVKAYNLIQPGLDPEAQRALYDSIASALRIASARVPACIGHLLPPMPSPVDVQLAERFRARVPGRPPVTDPATRAGDRCPRCGGTRTEQSPDGKLWACMDDLPSGLPCGMWWPAEATSAAARAV